MSTFALQVFFITYFSWWFLNIIFERIFKMSPVIIKREDILLKNGPSDLKKKEVSTLLMRNSRSLDPEGIYRIKTKPSLIFTKFLASLILSFWALLPLMDSQPFDEYIRLFYYSDKSVIQMKFIQGAAATTLSWYLFETIMINQYYKIQWSVILHHWLTSIAALLVLMNYFLPAAILYGILLVAFVAPVLFVLGFRVQYGFQYPKFIKKACRVSYYYYSTLIISCLSLQILMLFNGIISGSYSNLYIIFITICCIGWALDDFKAAKAIKKGSEFNYEDLNFNKIK
jgi:hypothetical protein